LELKATNPLLLDAPFIAVKRLNVKADYAVTYNQDIQAHVRRVKLIDPLNVTHGWRCDALAGNHDAIILISPTYTGPHITSASGRTLLSRDGDVEEAFQETQVHHT
jgi:hypothetical protein